MTDFLQLFNTNVYLTNTLLIPCLIFSILTYADILSWSFDTRYYSLLWLFISITLCFTIVFSNIHHVFMFGTNTFMQRVGKIDKVIAPFLGFIIILLNLLYIKYLYNSCDYTLKHITIPVYIISLIYSFIGLTSFIIRKKLLSKSHNLYDTLYIVAHTFFHYMTYSGMILLFLLYYIENQDIYSAIFNGCK